MVSPGAMVIIVALPGLMLFIERLRLPPFMVAGDMVISMGVIPGLMEAASLRRASRFPMTAGDMVISMGVIPGAMDPGRRRFPIVALGAMVIISMGLLPGAMEPGRWRCRAARFPPMGEATKLGDMVIMAVPGDIVFIEASAATARERAAMAATFIFFL
eukprot:CAMPEP_0172456168 /NCGR_PEP_ID=MMETSP1065-20121228/14241_1 /TAXON_ID=265537 /ORGANISM="Amphiprora paludosa, Strain CCMP125" /LENGTH=158 /DNA_ID=CAMNT_0013208873 /DNA_START=374 /DNA_END=850 /DNA_ORIENTATION=-